MPPASMPPKPRKPAQTLDGVATLTDTACKNAKPREKPCRLSDEKGLYLEIMPNGSKYFRLKYRFDGKEKRLAFGVYPEVSLKDARDKRDQARKVLAQGIGPRRTNSARP